MKSKILATIAGIFLAGSVSQAEGPSIYKDCGIGAMIFSGEAEWNRSIASIINLGWDLGSTASSSKSSGTCTRDGSEVAAAIFIHETYESVVEETAKGSGDHLTAVLDLLDVSVDSRSAVIADIQHKLSDVVSQSDYSSLSRLEKAEAYFSILDSTI